MKTNLKIILIALLVFIVGVNVPIKYFSFNHWFGGQKLGATITEITSADLLSDFPTVFNSNINNLNDDKIEADVATLASLTTANALTSASSLATVGTITSGTWRGTPIEVAYNGTGTTSPSIYQVILGNGALGLTVASSTGTTGQFLTSNGAGAYPSWQTSSIALGDSYAWTGLHTWTQLLAISASATSTFSGGIESGTKIGAPYFNATSTTATSTFRGGTKMDYATTTNLTVSGTCFNCAANGKVIVYSAQQTGCDNNECSASVSCPTGMKVVGGGATTTSVGGGTIYLTGTYFSQEGWGGTARESTAGTGELGVFAICVNP